MKSVSSASLFAAALLLLSPAANAQNVPNPRVPAPSSAGAAFAPNGVLPGGTTVAVSLTEPLSSSTAEVDDQVAIVVRKPVVIGGYVFVPEGASGHATVTSVEHAGGNGSGGKLGITMDWVYAADGGKIKLAQTNHASESGDSKGASSTATIATYLLLGPVGLFAHNFVRGREAGISTKTTFVVFVDHDVPMAGKPYAQPLAENTPR